MTHKTRKELVIKAIVKAERVRKSCNIDKRLPVEPIDLAEKSGCEVRFMAISSLEGIYSPDHEKGTIIIGSQRPSGRRAFTCAHELGHHVFKHGVCLEELNGYRSIANKSEEEVLADTFAAFLLMPLFAIKKSLKDRDLSSKLLKAVDVFHLASYFGVGYATIVNHMYYSLNLIDLKMKDAFLRVSPKQIKQEYNCAASSKVVFADHFWLGRPIDLEIDDMLVLPQNFYLPEGPYIQKVGAVCGWNTYVAAKTGYTKAFCNEPRWASHIRIAPKEFEGLARFRFYEEPEGDEHES